MTARPGRCGTGDHRAPDDGGSCPCGVVTVVPAAAVRPWWACTGDPCVCPKPSKRVSGEDRLRAAVLAFADDLDRVHELFTVADRLRAIARPAVTPDHGKA